MALVFAGVSQIVPIGGITFCALLVFSVSERNPKLTTPLQAKATACRSSDLFCYILKAPWSMNVRSLKMSDGPTLFISTEVMLFAVRPVGRNELPVTNSTGLSQCGD